MIHPRKPSLIAFLLLTLSACGEKPADQPVAMKINGEPISVAEVELKLEQYKGLPPQQKASVTEKMLASLADSEMLRQAAEKDGIDQVAAMQIRLNATRRLILANAYIEKTMAAVALPSPSEIKAYYDKNPLRFAERKVFDLQEISIQAAPGQVAAIDAKLAEGPPMDVLMQWLRAQNLQSGEQHLVVPADKVLDSILDRLGKAHVGEIIRQPGEAKITLLYVNDIQAQPLTLEQAAPMIQEQIHESRKAAAMESMLKQLRESSQVEYLSPYQKK